MNFAEMTFTIEKTVIEPKARKILDDWNYYTFKNGDFSMFKKTIWNYIILRHEIAKRDEFGEPNNIYGNFNKDSLKEVVSLTRTFTPDKLKNEPNRQI